MDSTMQDADVLVSDMLIHGQRVHPGAAVTEPTAKCVRCACAAAGKHRLTSTKYCKYRLFREHMTRLRSSP